MLPWLKLCICYGITVDQKAALQIAPCRLTKELLWLIINHFGYDDAAVALGCKSRRAEAERLGIALDAYSKRLQRKTASFKRY